MMPFGAADKLSNQLILWTTRSCSVAESKCLQNVLVEFPINGFLNKTLTFTLTYFATFLPTNFQTDVHRITVRVALPHDI